MDSTAIERKIQFSRYIKNTKENDFIQLKSQRLMKIQLFSNFLFTKSSRKSLKRFNLLSDIPQPCSLHSYAMFLRTFLWRLFFVALNTKKCDFKWNVGLPELCHTKQATKCWILFHSQLLLLILPNRTFKLSKFTCPTKPSPQWKEIPPSLFTIIVKDSPKVMKNAFLYSFLSFCVRCLIEKKLRLGTFVNKRRCSHSLFRRELLRNFASSLLCKKKENSCKR